MENFKQEVISAIRKTRKQGRQSTDHSDCAYRGMCGLKCVVGHMIPDELYDPEMDTDEHNTSIGGNTLIIEILSLSDSEVELLSYLQHCHDNCSCYRDFTEQFVDNITGFVDNGNLPEWCLEGLEDD